MDFERQDYDEKQNSWYFWIYSRNRELWPIVVLQVFLPGWFPVPDEWLFNIGRVLRLIRVRPVRRVSAKVYKLVWK